MKTTTKILSLAIVASLFATISCNDNDDNSIATDDNYIPTAAEFQASQQSYLDSKTQTFTFNTADNSKTFTTANGAKFTVNASCLTIDGAAVTGALEVKIVDLYDKSDMIMANKPTVGMNGSDKELLVSGGEYNITITQNGKTAVATCPISVEIPTSLTGGNDVNMIPWIGRISSADGSIVWNAVNKETINNTTVPFVEVQNNNYILQAGLGWFNCDRFYKITASTTPTIVLPTGYNTTNSAVYVAIKGEPNSLGNLPMKLPVGLEIYAIFQTVTKSGDVKYAVKTIIITENHKIEFTKADMKVATKTEFVSVIKKLP